MSVYDRVRHPEADRVAGKEPTASGFDHLRGHKYGLLVTFKRDGSAVPTPVWFGLAGGKAYVRTAAEDWKVKRIRRDPRARLGPCDARGKPKGPLAAARARVLGPDEEAVAEEALRSNYGLGRRLYTATVDRAGTASVYLEVEPA